MYLTGLEEIFFSIALKVVKQFSISVESIHLDSSSLSVEGEYENHSSSEITVEMNSEVGEQFNSPTPIQITYGYSRDQRPDLKQFMVDLICSGEGELPLFLRTGSGNESEMSQQNFPQEAEKLYQLPKEKLVEIIIAQQSQINQLQEEIDRLKTSLHLDSQTSSKPPSTDLLKLAKALSSPAMNE